ncbi:cystathionine gamma-lyase [Microdochium nivale]|nr:cystathionine gamma-lyase [Microdochium nivale]
MAGPEDKAPPGEGIEQVAHEDGSKAMDNGGDGEKQHQHQYQHLSLAARAIHAGDHLNSHQAVAPPMHVSTTFRYSDDPEKLQSWVNPNPANPLDSHVYSRDSAPNTTRLEAILASILDGPSLTYASGLSAFHAMLVHLNPRRIAIGEGYHGCHGVIKVMTKLTGLEQLDLDCPDSALGPGDVIHVETPLNPTGEARDLEWYAAKARRVGAHLSVDATFAPPPLLEPLRWGADVILHSGTKYFGGHSDMLCGVLTVAPRHAADWIPALRAERLVLGAVMGSFEGWLGARSLRTLEVRVRKQSGDAAALVQWLAARCASSSSSSSSTAASAAVTAAVGGGPGGGPTGYMIFASEQREKLAEEGNADIPFGSLGKTLTERWEALGEEQRAAYETRAGAGADDDPAITTTIAAPSGSSNSNSSSSSSSDDAVRKMVHSVKHASLQPEAASSSSWLTRQMPQGYGSVFSILLKDPECARRLPSKLRLFEHATSLGGVDSLIEWRAMTDRTVDPRLLRVSIGLEGWEDLRDDLVQGLEALVAEGR